MAGLDEMPERWLVRLMVTRDPLTESTPDCWKWADLLEGGDPVVLHAQMIGYETEEPCPDTSPSESS